MPGIRSTPVSDDGRRSCANVLAPRLTVAPAALERRRLSRAARSRHHPRRPGIPPAHHEEQQADPHEVARVPAGVCWAYQPSPSRAPEVAVRGHDQVITTLNAVLTAELTAINQYFIHARMCENWGY